MLNKLRDYLFGKPVELEGFSIEARPPLKGGLLSDLINQNDPRRLGEKAYAQIVSSYVNKQQEEPKPLPLPTPTPKPRTVPQVKGASTQRYDLAPAQESTYSAMFPYLQSNVAKEDYINQLILDNATKYNLDPNLFAALFTQETGRFRPDVIYGPSGFGPKGRQDFGIGQINEVAHPNVTRQQALDPYFAVPYAANLLRSNIDYFGGDINRGLASYNVGRGGASVKGPAPYGGGPAGQAYIDNVARNLSPELIEQLGLILSQ